MLIWLWYMKIFEDGRGNIFGSVGDVRWKVEDLYEATGYLILIYILKFIINLIYFADISKKLKYVKLNEVWLRNFA